MLNQCAYEVFPCPLGCSGLLQVSGRNEPLCKCETLGVHLFKAGFLWYKGNVVQFIEKVSFFLHPTVGLILPRIKTKIHSINSFGR